MTKRSRKAIIIGAGIAGPAAAVLLKRAGIDAQLFELWPYSTGSGGGLQIAPNGMHVLAELGLADEMIQNGSVADAFEFYSQSGVRLGSINHNMRERFGRPAVNMRRAALNEALVNRAWCENVELVFEKRLVRIDDHADQPVVAHFSDGTSAEGDFLIGADGVHSGVRSHVVPDGPKPFDTGLIGFGGFAPRALLEHTAIGRCMQTTFGQSGFFGYGFCSSDPDEGVMWWSTQPGRGKDAAAFRAMDQSALRRHLLDFHAGWHDPIPQLLEAAQNIVVTATIDVATLPTWSRGRTLLIGDAAHAATPHAGQGASLALEDALRLARLSQGDADIRTVFESFENERRPRAEKIVALARRNGNQKRDFSPTGAWVRDRILKLLIPLNERRMNWIYAYNPCAVTPRLETSSPHYRQAA